jgi:hypothetical protein
MDVSMPPRKQPKRTDVTASSDDVTLHCALKSCVLKEIAKDGSRVDVSAPLTKGNVFLFFLF